MSDVQYLIGIAIAWSVLFLGMWWLAPRQR